MANGGLVPVDVFGVHEPEAVRRGDSLRAAVNVELDEQVLDVGADGLATDEQVACNLGLGSTGGKAGEHLQLALAQVGWRADAGGARVDPMQRPQQPDAQLAGVERLEYIIVGAEQEPSDAIERIGPDLRDEHHRELGAEPSEELGHQLQAATGGAELDHHERRHLTADTAGNPRRGVNGDKHAGLATGDIGDDGARRCIGVDDDD